MPNSEYESFFWRRSLKPGQVSSMQVFHPEEGRTREIFRDQTRIIDGPNWSAGDELVFWAEDGQVHAVSATPGGSPRVVNTGGRTDLNHDHLIAPDGETLFFTTNDGEFYRVPIDGGAPAQQLFRQDDNLACRYLHGISPDEKTLLFIGGTSVGWLGAYDIYSFDIASGRSTKLTDIPRRHDGAEYSPDGEWIYFSSEREAVIPGHNQIFRMRPDGREVEQLTDDARVNWFPHLSPDGKRLVYVSYEPLVNGHPFNQFIELVFTDPLAREIEFRIELFGGNGTANENGWAPDSSGFAYVAYPFAELLDDPRAT